MQFRRRPTLISALCVLGVGSITAAWAIWPRLGPGTRLTVGPATAHAGPPSRPTFNRDVAPLIFSRCANCHRPGEAGPFPLLTYQDVRRRASQIVDVTGRRLMPPWLPEPGHGDFVGDRRLSDGQIATIGRWVEQGADEGAAADLPPPPAFASGWQLGEPDLVVRMPEPYVLPADGTDVYRNFVIPVPLDAGRWVKAAEIRPGNPRVVHHAFLLADRTPASRRLDGLDPGVGYAGMDAGDGAADPGGQFLSWQPGKLPPAPDEASAWRLDRGSDLVLQAHMRPTGKPEPVQAVVGLYFTDRPPPVPTFKLQLASLTIDVPPGVADYPAEDRFVLPIDVDARAVLPHAHYLCREMQGYATLPGGARAWLIHIRRWDFNWQGEYRYAAPVFLPKGTELTMRFVYDNSAANPANPNHPPRRVAYGARTADEMANLIFQLVPRRPAELPLLERAATTARMERIIARMDKALVADPADADSHFGKGKALFVLGRRPDALAHLREAARLKPAAAEYQDLLGRLLLNIEDRPGARRAFLAAVAADPKYYPAHTNLGLVALREQRFPEADAHLRDALAINPEDRVALNNLGAALLAQNRSADAAEQFEHALRLDPDDGFARQGLTQARRAAGR